MFEQLEKRTLMAVSATTVGWTLVIEGDNANNWVSVERSAGILWVKLYGSGGGATLLHVEDIHVDEIEMRGGGGNDLLTIANNINKPATVYGGAGSDYIIGGGGYNNLAGHGFGTGAHSDESDDGAADTLISGSGDSDLWGQEGADALYTDVYATSGSDHMFGGTGSDTFYVRGKDSPAFVNGEAGHDALIPYQNATQHVDFEGGSGTDRVDYRDWTAAVYVIPNGFNDSGLRNGTRRHTIHTDVEYVEGTDYDDHFSGNSIGNIFYGYEGDDLMYGYGGNDTLIGDEGDDTIHAGSGNDLVSGSYGNDALVGDAGHDTLNGGDGVDELHGGDGHDRLYGGNHTDYLYGDAGSDRLVGGAGSDYLDAHDGIFGNDTVYGDNENGTGGGNALDVAYVDRYLNFMDFFTGLESIVF